MSPQSKPSEDCNVTLTNSVMLSLLQEPPHFHFIFIFYDIYLFLPVHLREPLPAIVQAEHVHRPQGHQPLWTSGHAIILEIRTEEAQLRKCQLINRLIYHYY